jgi:hypothetical protein
MARRYGRFTPARRAALRKAQLASAQKRRAQGRRAKVKKYAKRTALGVGAVGAVAGAGYGAHRYQGNRLIVSKRTPTPRRTKTTVHGSPISFDTHGFRTGTGVKVSSHVGKPIGPRGFHRTPTGAAFTSRNKKGDKTILYAMGVNKKKVHGSKVGGGPQTVKDYVPTRGDFKNMMKHNRPVAHSEQYAREAMTMGHTTAHVYQNRRIEPGEAIRRTNSYVSSLESKGKEVSAGHRSAALKFFSDQPRYTGGTVKPLRRMSRRKARRLNNKRNSYSMGPTVLGSRKREKK